jgi:hypothetical protein
MATLALFPVARQEQHGHLLSRRVDLPYGPHRISASIKRNTFVDTSAMIPLFLG